MSASIAIGLFAIVAACGGDKNKADTTLAADSTLNRDLAMAGSDTGAQPQLRDVPAGGASKSTASSGTKSTTTKTTTTTTTKTPATTSSGNTVSTPTTGGGGTRNIAAGTVLHLTANSQVCTNTGHVGDTYQATLTSSVQGEGGSRGIPSGAVVTMKVTQLKRSENVRDKIVMAFDVQSVSWGGKSYPISGTVGVPNASIARVRNEPKSADVKKVVGGAAIGAIAGQILGKSTKSTVIGAAAGAAAGAGAAAATANYEGCIKAGAPMTVTLSQPLTIVSAARVNEGLHTRVGQ